LDEMTVRYDGSIVELKQRMRISINGFEVGLHQLPVKVGHVLVKQASHHLLQGMELAGLFIY
jgi:hypothetical protein